MIKEMCVIVEKEEGVQPQKQKPISGVSMCYKEMCILVDKTMSETQEENNIRNTGDREQECVTFENTNNDENVLINPLSNNIVRNTNGQINLNTDLMNKVFEQQSLLENFLYQDGEFSSSGNGCLYYMGKEVMNCLVRIDANVVSEKRNMYVCSIYINGEILQVTVLARDFTQGIWLYQKVPGFAISCDKGDATRIIYRYLNRLIKLSGNQNLWRRIRKPGWHQVMNDLCYVTPNGVIGRAEKKIIAEYGQSFGDLTDCSIGNINSFLEMMKLTPNSWASTIILLYLVMSFSWGLYRRAKMTPKFLLFVNGPRGSFKTSLSLLMTQIERNDSPEFNLKATSAGLEAGYRKFKDAIMLADDLAPAQEIRDQTRMRTNVEMLVRAFGDGTGIKRNDDYQNEDFEVEQYEAEGGLIITGEYKTGCNSSLSRCLFIPLKEADVDINLLSVLQEDTTRLPAFLWGFISFLTECSKEIIGFIKIKAKQYRAVFARKFSNPRYAEYYAQLLVAGELLMKFGVESHQLTIQEAEQYSCRFISCVEQAVNHNHQILVEESPITMLCIAITTKLNEKMIPIVTVGTTIDSTQSVIVESDTKLYIRQKDVYAMKEKFDMENGLGQMKYSSTALAEMLYNAGIISIYKEGNSVRYAKKIPGSGNIRYMELDKKKLYEIANM